MSSRFGETPLEETGSRHARAGSAGDVFVQALKHMMQPSQPLVTPRLVPPGCLYLVEIEPGSVPRVLWQKGTCGEDLTYQASDRADALAWRDIVVEEDRRRVDAHWKTLVHGSISSCVFRIRAPDGSTRWLWNDGWPSHDAETGSLHVYGVARDISNIVRATQEIRAQEAACNEVFATIDEGVWQFGRDDLGRYRVIDLNPGAERMERLRRKTAIGKPIQEVFPERVAELEAAFRKVTETGEPEYLPASYWEGERTSGWRDGKVYKLPSERILLVYRDITKRVEAEQEQLELEERLARACQGQSLGKLAGAVAHDFNNKLTPILGYTQLLEEELGPTHALYPDLLEIEDAAVQAKELARHLLDFSRRQLLDIRPLNLSQTVLGWKKMISRLLREDVHLEVQAAPPVWVRADGTRIRQLLLDMAVTASHALTRGGTLELAVIPPGREPAGDEDIVCLRARLSGEALDHSVLALDDEPADPASRGAPPLLNLNAMQEIVRQHDADLVKTTPSQTEVVFEVRLRAEPPPFDGPEPDILGPSARGSATLLLIEDAPAVRDMAKKILETAGYVVLAAADATSAIEIAEAYDGTIHLLLADVVLPQGDGKSLADRLVALRPGLKTLYMSGHPRDLLTQLGVTQDPKQFLPKPFSARGLLKAVRRALED